MSSNKHIRQTGRQSHFSFQQHSNFMLYIKLNQRLFFKSDIVITHATGLHLVTCNINLILHLWPGLT